MKIKNDDEIYIPTAEDVDDFNKVKRCRRCKKRVEELFPDVCPHCHKPFESTADYFFRRAAYFFVVLVGIYFWQKVMLGFF